MRGDDEMKTVTILLTKYSDVVSTLVYYLCGRGYTHASLSLDGGEIYYSFNYHGFCKETLDRHRHRGVKKSLAYQLHVSDSAYEGITRSLAVFKAHRAEFGYTRLGSQEAILNAVLRAAKQIEAETESRRLRGKNLDMQRRNFFREISCSKTGLKEIQNQAEQLGIGLPSGRCLMVSFKIEALKAMDEIPFLVQTKEWFCAIEDAIGKRCSQAGYDISFFQGKEYLNAVIMEREAAAQGEEKENKEPQKLRELLGDAMSRLMNQLNIHLYAGIGRWYETMDRIHDSYMEALKINNLRDVLDREYPKRQYPILEYCPDMFAEETLEELAGKVTGYINASYAKPELSLEQIAAQVHLSANYVSTLFKKHYGMNISDYMIKVRMEHAARLLSDTNFKTYEIAERVGYTNSQYFSVLFKKSYGMTPKEYRNQNKTQ